jgi:hypothetical protein
MAGRWFSQSTPVTSANKTEHQGIIEILLKVALNTMKPKNHEVIRRIGGYTIYSAMPY